MPQPQILTTELVRQNRIRRHLLGRMVEARQRLSAPGGQKAQKVITGAITQMQALMRANQRTLAELGGMSPEPVSDAVLLNALQRGDDNPLKIAFHLLTLDGFDRVRGPEVGLMNQCRQACRGACIKAEIGDPLAA